MAQSWPCRATSFKSESSKELRVHQRVILSQAGQWSSSYIILWANKQWGLGRLSPHNICFLWRFIFTGTTHIWKSFKSQCWRGKVSPGTGERRVEGQELLPLCKPWEHLQGLLRAWGWTHHSLKHPREEQGQSLQWEQGGESGKRGNWATRPHRCGRPQVCPEHIVPWVGPGTAPHPTACAGSGHCHNRTPK